VSAAIKVRGLAKAYGENRAVDGIDIDVETGEVVAILGPNGAGKTTTVEILEGFRHRDSGDVEVLGLDPATAGKEIRNRIGIVLQQSGIEEELTVREVLDHQRMPFPTPMDTSALLEKVGLTAKADARTKHLSGGQRRRLDLAMALIGNPSLLFLDEPTTGFDPVARRQSWDTIGELAASGTTVLLTTHYLDEAQHLADRVYVIAAGKVVADGTPDDLGGRADRPATISFNVTSDQAAHLGVQPVDGLVTLSTSDTTGDLHRLLSRAVSGGIELSNLEVRRPTLEETYFELVGANGGD
jgi:ABC-2 type transport system ATP-binding protein